MSNNNNSSRGKGLGRNGAWSLWHIGMCISFRSSRKFLAWTLTVGCIVFFLQFVLTDNNKQSEASKIANKTAISADIEMTNAVAAAKKKAEEEEAAAKKKAEEEEAAAKKKAEEEEAAAKKKAEEEEAAAKKKAEEEEAAAKKKAEEEEAAAKKKAEEEEAELKEKAEEDSDKNNVTRDIGHNPLPNCDELMQDSTSFADGSFLTQKTTPVVWKMRHDGSRELTLPSTCHLKRYTAQQAGKCLKGRSMLFIGDSLTRYTYLSLAYFLEHKEWPKRFHAGFSPCRQVETCSKTEEPNVCAENDWVRFGGWPAYIQKVGGGTDGGIFHGLMESQTIRTDLSHVDSNQYVSAEEDGGTRLSFYSEYGAEEYRGWDFTGCAYNRTCRYTPEHYEEKVRRKQENDYDWVYPNITTAFGSSATTLRALHQNTNYIFYNRGLWGALPQNKATKMMEAIRSLSGGKEETSNRCFFRSTTGCSSSKENNLVDVEYGYVREAAFNAGCEYFDVAHVTEVFSMLSSEEFSQVFWDHVHYVPWVYEELNQLLLNLLCNTQLL